MAHRNISNILHNTKIFLLYFKFRLDINLHEMYALTHFISLSKVKRDIVTT